MSRRQVTSWTTEPNCTEYGVQVYQRNGDEKKATEKKKRTKNKIKMKTVEIDDKIKYKIPVPTAAIPCNFGKEGTWLDWISGSPSVLW